MSFQLIVIDNASADDSPRIIEERFPASRVIRLYSNLGFAAANNIAAGYAEGRYLLLLNPDTVILHSAVDTLVQFADAHPENGIYGGSTRFNDMSRNPTAGWKMASVWSLFSTAVGLSSVFRSSRLFNPESLSWWDWSEPREIDIVTGCFLLIRSDLWKHLGGFDLQFVMYGEDADLCLRARREGARPILVPEAEIIHYGGASEKVRSGKLIRMLSAKVRLFRKHWGRLAAWYAVTMLKLWPLSRVMAFGTLYRSRPEAKASLETWREVWRQRPVWTGRAQ